MKTTHRSYDDTAGDFNRLCRLVIDHGDDVRRYSTWCLGRVVDWKYGLWGNKLAFADFCGQNAELWFDAWGELVGFAIAESGDADFAVITLAGYRLLYEEILDWVIAQWGQRQPGLSSEVRACQELEITALEARGFRAKSAFYTREFDLTRPLAPRAELPPGFAIVDMAAHPDYRAQRLLRSEAFDWQASLSEEEIGKHLEFTNHAHQGPIYHAALDLCVMAPDGAFVSCCEGMVDAHNVEADIERVATHSAYRRRGFARAVIIECLHRLQAIGLRRAYIAGYSEAAIALYGSLGHTAEMKNWVYARV